MFRTIILVLVTLLFVGQAKAERMADQAYTSVLLELNRIKPEQNPALTLGKNQLNARILDKNARTIGKVGDIIVEPNGKFQTIMSRIDAAGFRENVALDVASYVIESRPDTFSLSLDKDQLKQNIAQLMAATSTASGGENGPFTLSSLQKGTIYKTDGTPIAKVKDVLVDNRGMQIVSLLVNLTSGANRGATIAIPYEASTAKLNGSAADLTVTDAQASVIASMAKRR